MTSPWTGGVGAQFTASLWSALPLSLGMTHHQMMTFTLNKRENKGWNSQRQPQNLRHQHQTSGLQHQSDTSVISDNTTNMDRNVGSEIPETPETDPKTLATSATVDDSSTHVKLPMDLNPVSANSSPVTPAQSSSEESPSVEL